MARNQISTGIGLRHVRVALRDTDNMIAIPAAVADATAYAGIQIKKTLALTPTIPEPNRVPARGDDIAYHTFALPPTETPSGELRVSKADTAAIALISSTTAWGSPTFRKVGLATDKQGDESDLMMWAYREAIDSEEGSVYFGQAIWQTYILLNALATPRPASMEDQNVGEFLYALTCNNSTRDELGVAFSTGVNGFTKAPILMIVTKDKFWMDAFRGDGIETDFTLTKAGYLSTVDPVLAYIDGVSYSFTNTAGVIKFGSAPADGAKILIEYGYTS